MRLLCPSISKDIQVALLKDMVAKIVLFQDCNELFIIAITSLLEMISLSENFAVFHAGDLGDAMYVVNSGVLHVIVDGVKVREVRKGNFFGEMAMFLNRLRFATVVTTTYCTLYKLVRFYMKRVLVFSVRTLRACDLLSLSSEALLTVLYSHPLFNIALSFADQAVQHVRVHTDISMRDTETRWRVSTFSRANSHNPTASTSGAKGKLGLAEAVLMTTMASSASSGVSGDGVGTAVAQGP